MLGYSCLATALQVCLFIRYFSARLCLLLICLYTITMPEKHTAYPTPSLGTLLRRALLCRCPVCAKRPLYRTFQKQVDQCDECGTHWGKIEADDGPAWLVMTLLCVILVPIELAIDDYLQLSAHMNLLVLTPITILLAVLLLPSSKALFIALIWYNDCNESGKDEL